MIMPQPLKSPLGGKDSIGIIACRNALRGLLASEMNVISVAIYSREVFEGSVTIH